MSSVKNPNNTPKHWKYSPVSILRKSISGRHRPVRVADGPMTDRCRFTENASWEVGRLSLSVGWENGPERGLKTVPFNS